MSGHWYKWIFAGLSIVAGSLWAQAEPSQLPVTEKPYAGAADTLRFAIFSDRTGGARQGIFEDAVKKMSLLLPEFVINVGDCVEGYTQDADQLNREWDDFDRIIAQLPMKYYRVPGNHDLSVPMAIERWHQRYGRTYYHFVYKDALFLVLDTEDPVPPPPPAALYNRYLELEKVRVAATTREQQRDYFLKKRDFVSDVDHYMKAMISAEQYDYFAKVLADNKNVRWTFLFMHKPAWRQPYANDRFLALEKLLADRPYSVFAGHMHEYHHEVRNGRQYVVMATTGGEVLDPFSNQVFDHIALVTLDDRGPRVANLKTDGIYDEKGWVPPLKNGIDQLKAGLGIVPAP
jgi:hypothetical protein